MSKRGHAFGVTQGYGNIWRWNLAVQTARLALGVKGLVLKKGSPLYKMVKERYGK